MIGWYITGGILGLILLLLLLPIRIKLQYEEELYLWIGYAFFNIPILPAEEEEEENPEKPPPKSKKKKAKKPQESTEKKEAEKKSQSGLISGKLKEIVKYQGVSGLLDLLRDLAVIAGGTGKKLLSHLVVKKFDLLLTVGGEDAAETALLYGKLCGVVYSAVGTIFSVCKGRRYGVTVQPDFQAKELSAQLFFKGSIRLVFLVAYAVSGFFRFLGRIIRANRELEEAKPSPPPPSHTDSKGK